MEKTMDGILHNSAMTQIAFLVEDMEGARKNFSAFFGSTAMEPVSTGEYEQVQTVYNGKEAKEAKALLSFIRFGGPVEIELICPDSGPSIWRDCLKENGEGFHHIAFSIKNMDDQIAACEKAGIRLVQSGYYSDRSGRYAYLDARNRIGCYIELLESFETEREKL